MAQAIHENIQQFGLSKKEKATRQQLESGIREFRQFVDRLCFDIQYNNKILTEDDLREIEEKKCAYLDLTSTLPKQKSPRSWSNRIRKYSKTVYSRCYHKRSGYSIPVYRSADSGLEAAKRAYNNARKIIKGIDWSGLFVTLTCKYFPKERDLTGTVRDFFECFRNTRKGTFPIKVLKELTLKEFFELCCEQLHELEIRKSNGMFDEVVEAYKFIQTYDFDQLLKYFWVVEVQSRPHIHCLLNIDYLPRFVALLCWGNGIVDIRKFDSNEKAASYLAGYLAKTNDEILIKLNYRLALAFGKRLYGSSRIVRDRSSDWQIIEMDTKYHAEAQFEAESICWDLIRSSEGMEREFREEYFRENGVYYRVKHMGFDYEKPCDEQVLEKFGKNISYVCEIRKRVFCKMVELDVDVVSQYNKILDKKKYNDVRVYPDDIYFIGTYCDYKDIEGRFMLVGPDNEIYAEDEDLDYLKSKGFIVKRKTRRDMILEEMAEKDRLWMHEFGKKEMERLFGQKCEKQNLLEPDISEEEAERQIEELNLEIDENYFNDGFEYEDFDDGTDFEFGY